MLADMKRYLYIGTVSLLVVCPALFSRPAADPPRKSPTRAVVFSLIPGGGQLYNNQYIKAGILFGGALVLGIGRQLATERDTRDNLSWYLVGLYIYNLIDAYVDAHLDGFDQELDENIVPVKYQKKEAEQPDPDRENGSPRHGK